MKKAIIVTLFLSILANAFGQKSQKDYYPSGKTMHEGKIINGLFIGTHKYYYENGRLKTEVYYSNKGILLGSKMWDTYGNLIQIENFATKYKNYPLKNFSKITWTKIEEGVWIHKFNNYDTIATITDTSTVYLHYLCFFADGRMIDNSYERQTPLQAKLTYLTEGFRTGILQMKPGETALIKISPLKAYGQRPFGNIPPNSVLIYQTELLSVY